MQWEEQINATENRSWRHRQTTKPGGKVKFIPCLCRYPLATLRRTFRRTTAYYIPSTYITQSVHTCSRWPRHHARPFFCISYTKYRQGYSCKTVFGESLPPADKGVPHDLCQQPHTDTYSTLCDLAVPLVKICSAWGKNPKSLGGDRTTSSGTATSCDRKVAMRYTSKTTFIYVATKASVPFCNAEKQSAPPGNP